ncbi:MAG TPA: ATP-binding protein [Candidatus Baltobacteraceae bacterium]|nr:ATP-binding protein [Candidatus Baltobacteraceae bacterium]
MRARLFWKLGLSYLALLFVIFLAFDFYSSHVLRRDYVRAAGDTLESLTNLAKARPPRVDDSADLRAWIGWAASSGVRVTVIAQGGQVLADSAHDPETMENHATRPEIQQAFSSGEGESVRHSVTLGVDFVYRAVRYQPPAGPPVVIRMALPLAQIDASVAELRQRLLGASLLILAIAGAISLISFRMFAARVERLKRFSRRLAEGDFRPLPAERPRDELSELTDALNETAASMDRTIRSLSGERNRSSAILRSMVEGVAVVDAEERIVFSNRAFSEILNLDAAAIEGRPVIEVIRNTALLGLIRRALKGEEGLQTDIAMGFVQQRTFAITATPVQALESSVSGATFISPPVQEKPSGAVVVLHDVTELRRLERERQDFVANVSHEFKTPLTAIQGFAETLLAGAMEDSRSNRRFLEIIRDHAVRLARLTNDLLKLARIEAGKLEVEFFPTQLIEVIERSAETTLLKASQKQIALEVDVPPGLPMVRGDASLLRDVLQNLIDNAIQYTSEGGRIQVSASVGPRDVVVCVADTGIGIPLADQERIFERFYRVDAARSREAGGTGLGLSIAKHIVEAHGGRLWVESEVGRGSKFFFSVPLAN